MKYVEAVRKMHHGERMRRPKWARGAYLFAAEREKAKTGERLYILQIVTHEGDIEKNGKKITLLRPATNWVASPADLGADDWIAQSDEDAAGCEMMKEEGSDRGTR